MLALRVLLAGLLAGLMAMGSAVSAASAASAGSMASAASMTRRAGRACRRRWLGMSREAGMSTAEYAVGTIAACAFAAVLYQVVTGGSIVSALTDLISSALSALS